MRVAWDPGMLRVNQANQLGKVPSEKLSTSQRGLRKAADQFDSLFMQQLLGEMRRTVWESDIFGNRRAEKLFEGLLDQEVSDEMAKAGGIGLSSMVYHQLVRHVSDKD